MASSDFEKYVDLELNATLECGNCFAELEIDQEIDSSNASDTVRDSEQKLGVQAEQERWELSDLDGRLGSICACCDDCMRSCREGTLE